MGAADRSEYRQAAGAPKPSVIRCPLMTQSGHRGLTSFAGRRGQPADQSGTLSQDRWETVVPIAWLSPMLLWLVSTYEA